MVCHIRASYVCGSSPRVWGIRAVCFALFHAGRFIPTRVGNTRVSTFSLTCQPVHPHACGEYYSGRWRRASELGSSPRVWGILHHLRDAAADLRFIPTRVGNTVQWYAPFQQCAVHPHACGEYLPFIYISKIFGGSSPRVWGILGQGQIIGLTLRFIPTRVGNTLLPCIQEQLKRFIPTRVGNTQWTQLCTGGPPVHPHACGEYLT